MDPSWLPTVPLTPSGRPVLLPSEIERSLLPSVDLLPEPNPNPNSNSIPAIKSALLILTSHRLLLVDEPSSSARALPLSSVVHAFPPKKSLKHLFSTPKIRIQISPGPATRSVVLTIVIRGGGGSKTDPEAFYERLWEVLRARAWEIAPEESHAKERSAEGSSGGGGIRMPVVGVSGILRKEQEMWENTDKSLKDAFQDLNALMSKAKEMVSLAEKMRLKLLSNAQESTNDGEMGSKQEMQDWLLSVGIASPVTKESAGALYHQQLARQLADFIKLPLEKGGGMIALVDVYCLFNRARGTELISPEDLLQACALWEKLDVYARKNLQPFSGSVTSLGMTPMLIEILTAIQVYTCLIYMSIGPFSAPDVSCFPISSPVMLRKFDSGVKVIQSKAHSDEEVFERITSFAQRPDALRMGISPSDAALMLGIAPTLAKEHLLSAESKGLLCRDVSPDGFRFYANLFKEFDPANIYLVKDHGLFQVWISATSAPA